MERLPEEGPEREREQGGGEERIEGERGRQIEPGQRGQRASGSAGSTRQIQEETQGAGPLPAGLEPHHGGQGQADDKQEGGDGPAPGEPRPGLEFWSGRGQQAIGFGRLAVRRSGGCS